MDLKYIDRVSNLSKKRFIEEYYKPQRPVIIQDAIAQWPAYERWNFEYIRKVAGHKTVPLYDDRPVDHKDGFNEPHATMNMAEYIDLLEFAHAVFWGTTKSYLHALRYRSGKYFSCAFSRRKKGHFV